MPFDGSNYPERDEYWEKRPNFLYRLIRRLFLYPLLAILMLIAITAMAICVKMNKSEIGPY